MNKIQRKKRKTTLCLIMVFIMMLMTVTSMVAHAAAGSVSITVRQTYSTSSASAANTFGYILKPLNSDNPMPAGSASDGYSFTIAGNRSTIIGPIDVRQQNIYRYELRQVITRQTSGYTYDRRVYTVELHVDEDLNVTTIVKNELNEKESAIVFANAYNAGGGTVDPPAPTTTPTTPPTTTPTTTPSTPRPTTTPTTTPAPTPTGGPIATAPPRESPPATDTDGTPDIPGDIELPETGTDPGGSRPGPGIYGPKTGDDSNSMFYIILFALGGLLVVGTTVCLIVIGKRKKAE